MKDALFLLIVLDHTHYVSRKLASYSVFADDRSFSDQRALRVQASKLHFTVPCMFV